jgi:hypothetical protein
LERTPSSLREAEGIEEGVAAARAEPAGTLKSTPPLPIGVNIILAPHCRRSPTAYEIGR